MPSARENRAWVRDRVARTGLTAETEQEALSLLEDLDRMWKEVRQLCR